MKVKLKELRVIIREMIDGNNLQEGEYYWIRPLVTPDEPADFKEKFKAYNDYVNTFREPGDERGMAYRPGRKMPDPAPEDLWSWQNQKVPGDLEIARYDGGYWSCCGDDRGLSSDDIAEVVSKIVRPA
jgi:hypothetical protein